MPRITTIFLTDLYWQSGGMWLSDTLYVQSLNWDFVLFYLDRKLSWSARMCWRDELSLQLDWCRDETARVGFTSVLFFWTFITSAQHCFPPVLELKLMSLCVLHLLWILASSLTEYCWSENDAKDWFEEEGLRGSGSGSLQLVIRNLSVYFSASFTSCLLIYFRTLTISYTLQLLRSGYYFDKLYFSCFYFSADDMYVS